jgi:hypothetical protein
MTKITKPSILKLNHNILVHRVAQHFYNNPQFIKDLKEMEERGKNTPLENFVRKNLLQIQNNLKKQYEVKEENEQPEALSSIYR